MVYSCFVRNISIDSLFSFLISNKKHTVVLIWTIIFIPLISSSFRIPILYGLMLGEIIYFSGAYVLGMYLGSNIEGSMEWLKDHLLQIVSVALISTFVLCYLHFNAIKYVEAINVQDLVYYIQKICWAVIAIVLFRKLGEKQPAWLTKVAADSTPIYFIHGAIIFSCSTLFLFINDDKAYSSVNLFLGAILLLVFTIVLSMLISAFIKKVFGKVSRMIIGA